MEDEVRSGDLVERRLKRLDERGRKLLDEPDGVRQRDLASFGKLVAARGGVERREQLVVAQHIRIGQTVEKTRFSRVGVAGERHLEHAARQAALALQRSHRAEVYELALDGRDALAHHAAVDLELTFAFAEAGSAAAHAVGREVGPHAAQARIQVLILGEPHLEAAFAARRVEGEDVEDEGGPVDDLDVLVDDLLEVGLLRGAELVVEDDEVGGVGAGKLRDLLGLAAADERARIGSSSASEEETGHLAPGRSTPTRMARSRSCSITVAGPRWITDSNSLMDGILA